MATTKGRIEAISISTCKSTPKTNVPQARVEVDFGLVGDAHAGSGHRQVSLLAVESIDRLHSNGARVGPGDFAENITTRGLDLAVLRIGGRLRIGGQVELQVTQLGKRCHGRCAIFERLGDCVMPREGIFAKVLSSGRIRVGDIIEVVDDHSDSADSQ
jgi:MOSC domain-containing protein YiiM